MNIFYMTTEEVGRLTGPQTALEGEQLLRFVESVADCLVADWADGHLVNPIYLTSILLSASRGLPEDAVIKQVGQVQKRVAEIEHQAFDREKVRRSNAYPRWLVRSIIELDQQIHLANPALERGWEVKMEDSTLLRAVAISHLFGICRDEKDRIPEPSTIWTWIRGS